MRGGARQLNCLHRLDGDPKHLRLEATGQLRFEAVQLLSTPVELLRTTVELLRKLDEAGPLGNAGGAVGGADAVEALLVHVVVVVEAVVGDGQALGRCRDRRGQRGEPR